MDVVKFFQTGGTFMYPILIIFALGLSIAIERFIYIGRTQSKTRKVWQQLTPMLKAQDINRALKLTETVKTPLATMLNYGFARRKTAASRAVIESAMEEGHDGGFTRSRTTNALPGNICKYCHPCSDCSVQSSV